jgi:hypothetical protein
MLCLLVAGSCGMLTVTKSENLLETSKRKAHHCAQDSHSLSDILHVAELELQRLENQETIHSQKSARKMLFPKYHSEKCVVPKSHQTQAVSGTGVRDLHIAVKEEGLDTHRSTVVIEMKNENTFAGSEESSMLERPLKVQKIELLNKRNNNLISPASGKEVTRKLVKVDSLLSKKENHLSPMREMNCSFVDDNRKASNTVLQIHSPSVPNQINFTNSNDATTPQQPHFKTPARPVPSSHVKETDGLTEASSTDVGKSVPKVLCVGKGVTIIEVKLPPLTQCHTVPSNNYGNLMASGAGNNVLVPSQPVVPKQGCSPSSYVYKIGTGGSAEGSVGGGNIYRAVQVGTVIKLVPLCNNSLSITK